MNFFKNLLISVVILCTAQVAHAEYILFKKAARSAGKTVMQPLTEAEHAQAYPLLMKYQFPMSLCHDLEKELSKEELALLDSNEEAFIRSKLPKGIEIAFIPTVVYELFIIQEFINAPKTKEEQSNNLFPAKDLNDIYGKYLSQYKLKEQWNKKYYYDALKQVHSNSLVQTMHHLINNNLIIFSNANQLNYEDLIAKMCTTICSDKGRTEQDFFDSKYKTFFFNGYYSLFILWRDIFNPHQQNIIKFLQMVAHTESLAHSQNAWLIWRGALLGTDSTIYFGPRSLSFGNSLFAGIFLDYAGSAIYYIKRDFYCIRINKQDYREGKQALNFFHIPPLSTILGIAGLGECFHVRSKIFNLEKDPENPSKNAPLPGVDSFSPRFVSLEYLLTNTDCFKSDVDFNSAFKKYCKQNMIVLKQKNQPIQSKL